MTDQSNQSAITAKLNAFEKSNGLRTLPIHNILFEIRRSSPDKIRRDPLSSWSFNEVLIRELQCVPLLEAVEAVRALVFLANELIEYSPLEVIEPIEWKQKAGHDYRLKWRFSEDILSSWQITLNADLVVQLTDALRTAQLALDDDRGKRKNNTLTTALEAIEKARRALTDTIIEAEPKLERFLCQA